jgi:hypothetical protein
MASDIGAYCGFDDDRNVLMLFQTQAIDDVHRSIAETKDEETRNDGKPIVEALAALKYEMQHDRKLT